MDKGKKKSGSRDTANNKLPIGFVVVVSLAVGAVIGSAVTYSISKRQVTPTQAASPSNGLLPQAQTLALPTTPPAQQQFTPAAQPPGEVPPGKVWSVEHGHWHDAPTASTLLSPAPIAVPVEKKE